MRQLRLRRTVRDGINTAQPHSYSILYASERLINKVTATTLRRMVVGWREGEGCFFLDYTIDS
jgi:hypothetical protein